MPRSSRKILGQVVQREEVKVVPRDVSKQWSLKLKPSQLIYLKDDPDFFDDDKVRACDQRPFVRLGRGCELYDGQSECRAAALTIAGDGVCGRRRLWSRLDSGS